jgi:hypothetical protein
MVWTQCNELKNNPLLVMQRGLGDVWLKVRAIATADFTPINTDFRDLSSGELPLEWQAEDLGTRETT